MSVPPFLAMKLACPECGCGSTPSSPCGNIWYDDFTAEESGYTNTPANANFELVSGGRLAVFDPDGVGTGEAGYGTRTQLVIRPALNGLKLYAETQGGSYSQAYDPFATNYNRTTAVLFGDQTSAFFVLLSEGTTNSRFLYFKDENGDLQERLVGRVNTGIPATGAALRLEIHDTSAGAGTYDILCFVDDSLLYVECDVPLTIPEQVPVGVSGVNSYWDYLCVGSDTENRPRFWENAPTYYRFSIDREDTTFACYYRLPRDFEPGVGFTGTITLKKVSAGVLVPGSELNYGWYWEQDDGTTIWPTLKIDPITGGYDLTLMLTDSSNSDIEVYEGTVTGALSFSTPVTLTRNNGTSTGTCFSSVATIDVQPLECASVPTDATSCGAPLTGPNEILWLDYSIGGVAGRVCMSPSYNAETGALEYFGITEDDAVACVPGDVMFRIYCNPISDETGEPEWRIAVYESSAGTGSGQPVDDFPMEYLGTGPDAPLSVSGTLTNVCSGVLFDGVTMICADPPMLACCPTAPIAQLCCANSIRTEGTLVDAVSGTCEDPDCWTGTVDSLGLSNGEILCGGTPISPTGFNDTQGYYIGPVPLDDGFGGFDGQQLLLYCDGAAMRVARLDASSCVIDSLTPVWDCESFSGYVDLPLPSNYCCVDGGGQYRVLLG